MNRAAGLAFRDLGPSSSPRTEPLTQAPAPAARRVSLRREHRAEVAAAVHRLRFGTGKLGRDPVELARQLVPGLQVLMSFCGNVIDLYTATSMARRTRVRDGLAETLLDESLRDLERLVAELRARGAE